MRYKNKLAKGIYLKEVKGKYGDFLIADIKSLDFIKWLNENTNERGYCNLKFPKRKEIGKYGNTHIAFLNEEKEKNKNETNNPIPGNYIPAVDDDLPF